MTRTVMWCGTFLRFGLLTAAVALSATTASALDPNARVADDEPLIPTVQALAPLPVTPTAIPAPPAPVLSQLPPGISPKLIGPTVAGNAINASEAFRAGTRLYYEGDRKAAIEQLKRAAESGHPIAQWKLGRIYQTGDGVPANDAKAFEFYNQVANNHADDSPTSPQSAFVASAFVALGGYYLKGVENTAIRPNVQKAREIYTYAASYFGDADAQFNLGRLYLDAASKERDPKQAARWLKVAAKKGHVGAQALLGQLLFTGDDDMPRRPAQGLMWLTVARANAHAVSEDWIRDAQEQAFSVASEQERRLGVAQAQDWIAKAGNQ
ncbi:tetratricopeptide repeat protein [Pinisolibacter sp.]|uniref:tetratricopeptide repeat protein n=1 Tax=Pinisolibacter sp. TaxID=2172024 RepID=UPI002FDE9F1F